MQKVELDESEESAFRRINLESIEDSQKPLMNVLNNRENDQIIEGMRTINLEVDDREAR